MLWNFIPANSFLMAALMVIFSVVITIAFYRYPFCEKCRGNWHTKRIKNKKFCEIHGELET